MAHKGFGAALRPRRARLALAAVALSAFALAGCDRCGGPVKFNAPVFPKVCYDTGKDKTQ
ncbi:hypothetical protein [Methylocella sp.]|uniref:hypothetical protein n=1 Tax=Methylocella sp. TaxID=1978226 RepID=UPI003782D8B0